MSCSEMQSLIDGYFDNELDLLRTLEIEKHMQSCAACADHLKHLEALRMQLRAPSVREEAPAHLRAWAKNLAPAQPRQSWLSWGFMGAVAATALAFVIAAPFALHRSADLRLADEVVAGHVRSLMASHLTDVQASNQHVVKPWFNGRLDFTPVVQDFSDRGFVLAGGRLDYIDGRPVAAIVYHRALHPINLFAWPSTFAGSEKKPFKSLTRHGYHLLHGSVKCMTLWIISDLNANELKDFAELVERAAD